MLFAHGLDHCRYVDLPRHKSRRKLDILADAASFCNGISTAIFYISENKWWGWVGSICAEKSIAFEFFVLSCHALIYCHQNLIYNFLTLDFLSWSSRENIASALQEWSSRVIQICQMQRLQTSPEKLSERALLLTSGLVVQRVLSKWKISSTPYSLFCMWAWVVDISVLGALGKSYSCVDLSWWIQTW